MNIETLRSVADLMREMDITHLSLEEEGLKLELKRGVESTPAAAVPLPYAYPAPVPAVAAAVPSTPATVAIEPVSAAPAKVADAADEHTTDVCAPMVGVFYVAPAPGAEPFVRVGTRVKKGQTLCILEAMKLMNEIEADRDGEIAEICADDGELVEYGRVLFKIY